jgi:hypothetical protein
MRRNWNGWWGRCAGKPARVQNCDRHCRRSRTRYFRRLVAGETVPRGIERGGELNLVGVPEHYRGLLDEVRQTNRREARSAQGGNWLLAKVVHHLDRVAWQAVPIILLITFLIGGIIAQQGIFHFRKFGAEDYVVDLVGILILREIGVLLVAIMVAGRSGSSYTAELGSMKMREEIDALRTMGSIRSRC